MDGTGRLEVRRGLGISRPDQPIGRPLRHDLPAVRSGAGSQVDQPIGRANRRLVVLDHHHAVSGISQVLQAEDEAVGVARMQPTRRLVQNIASADQSRRRFAPPGGPVAARRRRACRPAGPGPDSQAHSLQEAQSAQDLLHQGRTDASRGGANSRATKYAAASSMVISSSRASSDRRGSSPALRTQPGAAASRAGLVHAEGVEVRLLASVFASIKRGVQVRVQALREFDDRCLWPFGQGVDRPIFVPLQERRQIGESGRRTLPRRPRHRRAVSSDRGSRGPRRKPDGSPSLRTPGRPPWDC